MTPLRGEGEALQLGEALEPSRADGDSDDGTGVPQSGAEKPEPDSRSPSDGAFFISGAHRVGAVLRAAYPVAG
jgi:hypothetical protein